MSVGKVRIVSDGTPQGTQILDAAGDPLKLGSSGITHIDITIEPRSLARATITISPIFVDVDAVMTLKARFRDN